MSQAVILPLHGIARVYKYLTENKNSSKKVCLVDWSSNHSMLNNHLTHVYREHIASIPLWIMECLNTFCLFFEKILKFTLTD